MSVILFFAGVYCLFDGQFILALLLIYASFNID